MWEFYFYFLSPNINQINQEKELQIKVHKND